MFDDAKFGIFIHWGPYSVPGWGNSTPWESYAEWFWLVIFLSSVLREPLELIDSSNYAGGTLPIEQQTNQIATSTD